MRVKHIRIWKILHETRFETEAQSRSEMTYHFESARANEAKKRERRSLMTFDFRSLIRVSENILGKFWV